MLKPLKYGAGLSQEAAKSFGNTGRNACKEILSGAHAILSMEKFSPSEYGQPSLIRSRLSPAMPMMSVGSKGVAYEVRSFLRGCNLDRFGDRGGAGSTNRADGRVEQEG
jgi:hypothetical protein